MSTHNIIMFWLRNTFGYAHTNVTKGMILAYQNGKTIHNLVILSLPHVTLNQIAKFN